VGDPSSERAALLEQVAGYLAWEEELSGEAFWGVEAELRAPQPGPSWPKPPRAAEQPAIEPGARSSQPASGNEQRSTLVSLASLPPAPATEAPGDLRKRLAVLEEQVRACTRCELHKARTQTVFARGNPESRLVFVGEGPGQEEDRTGSPFVGPAGQLLDKMVAAMGFGRDDVYICNIVKCRPPGNRTPLPSEAGACAPFLLGQLDAISPAVIVALGRCAAENMGLVAGGGWRGRWGKFRGVDVMPTYHPAFLLRSPEFKRPVWEDLQKVTARLQLVK
jgi:uracil-DNA glycosylase family 4